MGFELNLYDPCVANCEIEGKQFTIGWYVDDTKTSHVNPTGSGDGDHRKARIQIRKDVGGARGQTRISRHVGATQSQG